MSSLSVLLHLATITLVAIVTPFASAVAAETATSQVEYRSIKVGDLDIFYREAGPKSAPAVLLLHGFPSSSFMFRDLIPALARHYHVIAPDYPGFGQSSFPDAQHFRYTFASLAQVMDKFVTQIGVTRYALYVQDYGSPIGLRLALQHPERVTALIVQNGNAYEEGLSDEWNLVKTYWRAPTADNRDRLQAWLAPESIRASYVAGIPAELLPRLSPDTWTLDQARLNRPGNLEMQKDLFGDYQTNVALYPKFQAYLREHHPPTLVVWGRYDVFFTEAGALAYERDVPGAEIHLLNAGHFALETHSDEIAELMLEFLKRRLRLQ